MRDMAVVRWIIEKVTVVLYMKNLPETHPLGCQEKLPMGRCFTASYLSERDAKVNAGFKCHPLQEWSTTGTIHAVGHRVSLGSCARG